MKKNLLQKTLYEIHQEKQSAGYKIVEGEDIFVLLWNSPKLAYLDKAHCETITEKNYKFLKANFSSCSLNIATNQESALKDVPYLIFKGISDIMLLKRDTLIEENSRFEIRLVQTKDDIRTFSEIAAEVFNMKQDVENIQKSLEADMGLKHCHKYIGYDGETAAGIVEFSEGKEAVYICWAAVKKEFRRKGLCHDMFVYGINREIEKNFKKFVLLPSAEGKRVYSQLGFRDYAIRYNYTLKNEDK